MDRGQLLVIDLDRGGCRLAVRRVGSSEAAPAGGREVAHARLGMLAGEWAVSYPESSTGGGALLNGEPVLGGTRLQDHDVLRVGGIVATFRSGGGRTAELLEADLPEVSAAEQRVLEALARPWTTGHGLAAPATNAEIATELVVSVHTVKSHLRSLFGKFELAELPQSRKRAALVEAAFRSGLVGKR